MILPRPGDEYPLAERGPHGGHRARIVAVDTAGIPAWDEPVAPPTIIVACDCGFVWAEPLPEAVAA